MTAEHDVALTVALAEYELVREHRRLSYEGATSRFNSFLFIASGGTAVVASLLGTSGGSTSARLAAGAIGCVVLLLGFVIFVRLVHYQLSTVHQVYNQNLLREYLMRCAPQVRPYTLLPGLDTVGTAPFGLAREQGVRAWTGYPQTVGLVNSLLLALGVGVLTGGTGAPVWVTTVVGTLVGCASLVLHRTYEQRLIRRLHRRLRAEVEQRLPDLAP